MVIGIIGAVVSIMAEKERKKGIEEKMSKLSNFNFTQKVEQDEHYFVFGIDSMNKKVIFITPEKQRIVDYSQISSVELVTNGVTVASRSLSSLVGASLVGGVVGAMAVNQKIQEKANKVVVKVSFRNLSEPFITLVCLAEGNDVKINEWPYQKRVEAGKKVVDLLKIVIDEVEHSQSNTFTKPETRKQSIADELLKLAELKEKGILTEEEFIQQKAKLLNENNNQNKTDDPVERKVIELIQSGQKLQACKYYIEATNCDVNTAYKYIEERAK